jgi:hypothetical protein
MIGLQESFTMPLYLTSKSIPELTGISRTGRRRLLKRCAPRTFRHWQTWAALLAGVVCAALGAYWGWTSNDGSWVGGASGAILGAAIGGVILGQVKGELVRPYLRAELQRQRAHRRR